MKYLTLIFCTFFFSSFFFAGEFPGRFQRKSNEARYKVDFTEDVENPKIYERINPQLLVALKRKTSVLRFSIFGIHELPFSQSTYDNVWGKCLIYELEPSGKKIEYKECFLLDIPFEGQPPIILPKK